MNENEYFGKLNARFDRRAASLVKRGFKPVIRKAENEISQSYYCKKIGFRQFGVSNEFIMHSQEQSWGSKVKDIDRLEEIENSDLNWEDEPSFDMSEDARSMSEYRV